jgi:hypothetical protein
VSAGSTALREAPALIASDQFIAGFEGAVQPAGPS